MPLVVGVLLGVLALTACVSPGDDSEIQTGTSPTKKLTDELERLGVTLPPDASEIRWLTADTWDTSDTYVRLTATRGSVWRLLRHNGIEDGSLLPLSQAVGYEEVLPAEVLSGIPTHVARPTDLGPWSLRDDERGAALAHPMDDHRLPSVGAIVVDPTSLHPTVILHWYR